MSGGNNNNQNWDQAEYMSHLCAQVFTNGLVVSLIAEKLDFAALKTFRQINRFCRKESKKTWRKTACFRIEEEDDSCQKLQQFISIFSDGASVDISTMPFENFSLKNWSRKGTKTITKFVELCAVNIKHLKIVNFKCNKLASERDSNLHEHAIANFLRIVRRLIENVETLNFSSSWCCFLEDVLARALFSSESYLPALTHLKLWIKKEPIWFYFLEKIPNLRELSVVALTGTTGTCWHDFIFLLDHVRVERIHGSKTPSKISNLQMIGTGFNENIFLDMDMPLQHLGLSLTKYISNQIVADVLNKYGQNLITLKLLGHPLLTTYPFSNVQLTVNFDNLTEMQVWGNVVDNLNFLKKYPVLVKLTMDNCYFRMKEMPRTFDSTNFEIDLVQNSVDLIGLGDFSVPTLKEFVTDYKFSMESWNQLKNWMPNLKVLHAPISDNFIFARVCQHWPLLETLCARFGSKVDDEGITGGASEAERSEDARQSVGISHLKNLMSFEMEVECGQAKLTDKSAELGFLELQQLKSLVIAVSDEKFSDEMERNLKRNVADVMVFRKCGNSVASEKTLKCCEWAKRVRGD